MNRIIPKTDWIIIAAIGLLFQSIWLIRIEQPTYLDAYYYSLNGERLADGHGFSEMVIWQYLDDPAGLPTPSHTYWMPLPSMMAALGFTIRGDFLGQQLIFWLLGGLLPLLAFAISLQISGQRWQAWVAALFTVTGSFFGAFLSQPSTFTPYAWSAGLCLLLLGLASTKALRQIEGSGAEESDNRKPWLYWLLAGVTAGLAHLTRADGILLFIVGTAIWIHQLWLWRVYGRNDTGEDRTLFRRYRQPLRHFVTFVGGYLLIMGGWFIRNWIVIGGPFSSVGVQTIFLSTYDDLFAYGRTIDLGSYLAWGFDNILRSKLESLWVAVQTLVVVVGLIFLVPFIVVALVHHYRRREGRALLRPVVWYIVALLVSMTIIFTFPGMRGAMFHSSSALWPWSTALAAAGIGLVVDWTAIRLPHWQPNKAKKNFSTLFILIALVFSLYVSQFRALPQENSEDIRQILDDLPDSSVVMAGNAPAINYHTDLASVSVPNEPLEILLQAAQRYGVTHLLLDENQPVPLRELYLGRIKDPRVRLLRTVGDSKLYQLDGPS